MAQDGTLYYSIDWRRNWRKSWPTCDGFGEWFRKSEKLVQQIKQGENMNKITKNVIPAVTKTVVVTPAKTTYTVELTQDQVDLIILLTGSVAGIGNTRSVSSGLYSEFKPHGSIISNIHANGKYGNQRGDMKIVGILEAV